LLLHIFNTLSLNNSTYTILILNELHLIVGNPGKRKSKRVSGASRGEEVDFTVGFTVVTDWSDLESSVAVVMMGGMEAVGDMGGMEAVGGMEAMGGMGSSAVVVLKRPEKVVVVVVAWMKPRSTGNVLVGLEKQRRGYGRHGGGVDLEKQRRGLGRGRRRHGGSG
jgi:hypothetical protein